MWRFRRDRMWLRVKLTPMWVMAVFELHEGSVLLVPARTHDKRSSFHQLSMITSGWPWNSPSLLYSHMLFVLFFTLLCAKLGSPLISTEELISAPWSGPCGRCPSLLHSASVTTPVNLQWCWGIENSSFGFGCVWITALQIYNIKYINT